MLAPYDKVKKRGGNDIIQVVITRNCDIGDCSECTQLLPFRKDPREMTLECIEESLIALKGWPGVIACFGGNPCTHSKFPEVCKLWEKHVPAQSQRGLWTNDLLKYGEQAKETFWPHGRFNLNVHGDKAAADKMNKWLPGKKVWGITPSMHGGQLLDYADLGVSEGQWVELRENCDINKNWSGAVYARDYGGKQRPFIYFCERAGALDGVRGTNYGILAEPGCWTWRMDKYGEQVAKCCDHVCGVPLRTKGYVDSDRVYGVSPSLLPLLTDRVAGFNVRVDPVTAMPQHTHELTDYQGLHK